MFTRATASTRRARRVAILAAITTIATSFVAPAADAALTQTGPVDPATAVPVYYGDANGTRLQICADAATICFSQRPDLTQPLAIGNMPPVEAMYFDAEANIARNVGTRAF